MGYGSIHDNGKCGWSEWRSATCPICGKRYRHTIHHVYHAGERLVCSYGCQRAYERAQEAGKPREERKRSPDAVVKQKITRARKERRRYERELEELGEGNPARRERLLELIGGWDAKIADLEGQLTKESL